MFTFENFLDQAVAGGMTANAADQFAANGNGQLGVLRSDPGLFRPYIDERGRGPWVDVTVGTKQRKDPTTNELVFNHSGDPVMERVLEPQLVRDRMNRGLPVANVNNATTLPKDSWIRLDQRILTAARKPLKAWADLRAANTFGGFDGMSTPILEYESVTDPGEATQDMSVTENLNSAPKFSLQGMPLPITFSCFQMDQRFLAASRNRNMPQDTMRGEYSGRRIAEYIEQQTIGLSGYDFQYGDATDYDSSSKVYGYINHPDRITKTDLTAAATSTGETMLDEILAMITLAEAQNFDGPYVLYVSSSYEEVLRTDFKANSDKSARSRILEIDQISKISRLKHLTGDVMVLVTMDSDTAEAVNGMDVTTVQYDKMGGMQLCFIVMAIQVPRIRSKYVEQTSTKVCGIVHATTS